jgi:integrase
VTFAGFVEHDLKELIDYRRWISGEPDPLLFPAPQGAWEYRRNFNRRFRAAASRANWPRHITWYSLRHLYGATMLRTLPLEVVSKLMGHHSPDFTAKRYLSPQVDWFDGARAASRALDPFDL